MADWGTFDMKSSWVAVFLLLILWWLSLIPSMLSESAGEGEGDGKVEDGATVQPSEHGYSNRSRKVARHFRDGLLFLLTSVGIAWIASAPEGATNALAWIFTAFWIILGIMLMFIKWRRLLNALAFLDLVLLIALISNAFAHPGVRGS